MGGKESLFQAVRRAWCWLVGHDEGYEGGGWFYCYRCQKERPE